jgi:V/A-type H+/Na+-transporting ATPase subunit C
MSDATTTRRRSSSAGSDYGYSNARIRGMRSRLLDRSFLDRLIEEPSVTRLIQDLTETEYGPDLEEALIHGRDATNVDIALTSNMVRTFQKIMGFLNPEAEYLVTTLLGRWDIFNIKTILRAKHMHLSTEELKGGLLPAGQLAPIDLEHLAGANDVRAVVDTAVTWGLPMAGALREGHAEFMRTGELASLELALDRYYTEWARQRLARRGANTRMAQKVLAMQVDVANLVMVLRLQSADIENVDVGKFFLEGGAHVTMDLYLALAGMSDIDEVLDRLGIGVAISYLWAKQNEVTNLRIIVKGKSVGMPVDRVRKELILV